MPMFQTLPTWSTFDKLAIIRVPPSKNCTVLVTHKIDEPMLRYLRFLKGEIAEVMDFYILYDTSSRPLNPEDYPDLTFHLFNSREIKGFFHGGHPKLPNPLLPLLSFAGAHPYRHYLVMEGDLVLCGEWRNFVRKVNGLSCDYIHIASDDFGDVRRHFPFCPFRNDSFKHLYATWCHIFCVSHRYLMDLGAFMKENDTFYYEMLLPTMAYNGGYYIRQFENLGYKFEVSSGPAEVFERKYLEEHSPKTFYHPVKNSSLIQY